jgi:hypothetical protein
VVVATRTGKRLAQERQHDRDLLVDLCLRRTRESMTGIRHCDD